MSNLQVNSFSKQFNQNFSILVLVVAPGIITLKGDQARFRLADAFQQYFENYVFGHTQGFAMIQTQHFVAKKYEMTL